MRPFVAVLIVALTLTVIGMAWAEAFGPGALLDDGFAQRPLDAMRYVVTRAAPRYDRDPTGIRVGDILDYRRLSYTQRLRIHANRDDGLIVPVQRRSSVVSVTLHLAPNPEWHTAWPAYVASAIVATLAVGLFAVLLLRRPSLATAALFFYGCGSVDVQPILRELGGLPDWAFTGIGLLIVSAFYEFPLFVLIVFLTRFPTVPVAGAARLRMRIGDGVVAAGGLAAVVLALTEPLPLGWNVAHAWLGVVGTIATLAFAALAYRSATGEVRQRIGWVLVGLVATDLAYLVGVLETPIALSLGRLTPLIIRIFYWAQAASSIANLTLPIALTYAIVRHRVLDLGFALNRAAVFTATSLALFGLFGGLQWAANDALQRATRAQGFAIQLGIAVIILLAVRAVRTRAEALVSGWLFAGRRRRITGIAALANEVDEAATSELLGVLVVERLASLGIGAAIELRARHGPALNSAAVPFRLTVRGREIGVLWTAPPSSEGDFAPDESQALAGLANRVALAATDLRAEGLAAENATLRRAFEEERRLV